MLNIFIAVFFATLAFAFVEPFFFIGYLISIAIFGLYQAIFMANAGGAWDNAKKIVEVELKQKGTPLHDATVIGDTVGDPFKDTSSVALNPVIKFTTLFGLLAVELAVQLTADNGCDADAHPGGGLLPHFVHVRLPLVLRHAHRFAARARRLREALASCAVRRKRLPFVNPGAGPQRPALLLFPVILAGPLALISAIVLVVAFALAVILRAAKDLSSRLRLLRHAPYPLPPATPLRSRPPYIPRPGYADSHPVTEPDTKPMN